MLGAASAFAWILVREWVPQFLGDWIVSAGAGRTAFLAVISDGEEYQVTVWKQD